MFLLLTPWQEASRLTSSAAGKGSQQAESGPAPRPKPLIAILAFPVSPYEMSLTSRPQGQWRGSRCLLDPYVPHELPSRLQFRTESKLQCRHHRGMVTFSTPATTSGDFGRPVLFLRSPLEGQADRSCPNQALLGASRGGFEFEEDLNPFKKSLNLAQCW